MRGLVRGEVIARKQEMFVTAARAIGAGPGRIVFRHILPNVMTPVIVKMSLDMGFAILTVASLGFIGIGVKPPTPEWGSLLSIARNYMPDYWWTAIFPAPRDLHRGVRVQPARRRAARRPRPAGEALMLAPLLDDPRPAPDDEPASTARRMCSTASIWPCSAARSGAWSARPAAASR